MTEKTEIKIDGGSIIYNGVKYQKVQEESKKNTPNLTDIIENTLDHLIEFQQGDVSNTGYIAEVLVREVCQYIPDYSDWEDALKEFPEGTFSEGESGYFRDGWNAYCKKMWDMINDD